MQTKITSKQPKILAIVGQTASGKSALAVALAKAFGGEIISADSRQVYRGLDIGSGKITKKEMQGVPHHLLDVASPKGVYTVAHFEKQANTAIKKILQKGKLPIICGGTGFYVDAVLSGNIFPQVKPNAELRKKLADKNTEELFSLLQKLDPRRAGTIDPHNKVRLIRAIEIASAIGSVPVITSSNQQYDSLIIAIKISPKKLKEKIKKRLDERLQNGMIEEVITLHRQGLSLKRLEALGLEYRFIARYLRGLLTKETMTIELEKEINKFAKRQMTWFKRNKKIRWIAAGKNLQTNAAKITKRWLRTS